MDSLTQEDLRALVAEADGACLSFFLPTPRTDRRRSQLTLRHLHRKAEARLTASGFRAADVAGLLRPVGELLDNPTFWHALSDGLALFVSPGLARQFRLPRAFAQQLVVGRRFHLKPLLPVLREARPFFILALSQKHVRLLRATRHSVAEVPLAGVAQTVSAAAAFDTPDRAIRYRSSAPAGAGGYVGGGMGPEGSKEMLHQFCVQIDRGVRAALRDEAAGEDAPLILAGVPYLRAVYLDASRSRHLSEIVIDGSPERLAAEALRDRAWEALRRQRDAEQAQAGARLADLLAGSRASTDLAAILPAARQGRVEILFVDREREIWGVVDAETDVVHPHTEREPWDDDLLDAAAAWTHIHGGRVFAVTAGEMPSPQPAAAVLRH